MDLRISEDLMNKSPREVKVPPPPLMKKSDKASVDWGKGEKEYPPHLDVTLTVLLLQNFRNTLVKLGFLGKFTAASLNFFMNNICVNIKPL